MKKLKIRNHPFILGSFNEVCEALLQQIKNKSTIILPCSLNDLASDEGLYKQYYSKVDVYVADGMPIVWYSRIKGIKSSQRIYGPDLMKYIISKLSSKNYTHSFIGTDEVTLSLLQKNLVAISPSLQINHVIAPPILSIQEIITNVSIIKKIQRRPPTVLWIGLSSPKQVVAATVWKKLLPTTTIICVGAAFEFISNTKVQAPRFIQQSGLEWLFRLVLDPRRLGYRYLIHIPTFIIRATVSRFF